MHKFIEVLNKEVVPAQGCTEPIAVAYAVSIASEQVEGEIESVQLYLSGNIVKNALGVGIPGTGMTGIDIAALLGAVIKRSDKKLEILCDMTPEQLEKANALLEKKVLRMALADSPEKLYVQAVVKTNQGTGRCILQKEHTNVILIEKNGEVVFEKKEEATAQSNDHVSMSVDEIYDFAMNAPFDDISFILEGAKMNKAVSNEGLRGDYGLRVGKALKGQLENGFLESNYANEIVAAAAAASDARMDGCAMPIMTTAGSGNQGISCTVAVATLAEKMNKSQEELARALVLSNLITIHVKSGMGRLSPLCGSALAGGCGSSCAMIYLMGGTLEQMKLAINTMLANQTGMICDGAKTTCALKIASGMQAAVLATTLALNGIAPCCKEGIVCKDVEDTIKGLGKIATTGIPNLDPTILDVMLHK
ncbi:L-cysteine desulfidase family protein [Acidaminobacterium chupaoyuni]